MTPPHPTPLHALAEGARSTLDTRVAALADAQPVLDLVRREGRRSVNMKPAPLLDFLKTGRRLHMFALAAEESARTGRPVAEILRTRLREYTDARLQFEEQAGGGQNFHYGNLNAGGMGAPRYGRYCVVDRTLAGSAGPDPVWVAEDSLKGLRFRGADGQLSWPKLSGWVAPHDRAAELAALKFAGAPEDPRSLAERICNDDDYIEALSVQAPRRDHVGEIRLEARLHDDLQERALKAILSGSTLANDLDLGLHVQIRDHASKLGVPLVVVPP